MSVRQRLGDERGQLLAIFALALVAIIGMVGLIIDGGDTFVQRREQQNVADAAAMAAGYAYVNGADPSAAAVASASRNGYTSGTGSTTVAVSGSGGTYTVTVSRPHRNFFAGVMGFATWDVAASATVKAGVPNGVYGAMPLIFNQKAFKNANNRNPNTPMSFAEPLPGNEDVPLTDADFNWTVYCTANGNPCNADSNTADRIIKLNGKQTTIWLNDNIAPLNAGAHTDLFSDLADQIGEAYPVGIVNDDGQLVGWAMFRITGSVGGSTKTIAGYFEADVNAPPMYISGTGGTPYDSYGAFSVKLIN